MWAKRSRLCYSDQLLYNARMKRSIFPPFCTILSCRDHTIPQESLVCFKPTIISWCTVEIKGSIYLLTTCCQISCRCFSDKGACNLKEIPQQEWLAISYEDDGACVWFFHWYYWIYYFWYILQPTKMEVHFTCSGAWSNHHMFQTLPWKNAECYRSIAYFSLKVYSSVAAYSSFHTLQYFTFCP